jgi:hypothetical protein
VTGNRNNPAGRLRYWIDRFDTFPPGVAVSQAAATLLGLDPESTDGRVAFMRLGTAMADMCSEVRVEAALLPESLHPDMLLSDFPQVEAYVARLADARQIPVQDLGAVLDPAGRRGLEYLDRYLATNRPQRWIDDDDRAELIDKVRHLVDQVAVDPSLSASEKDFVIIRLNEVLSALRDADLTGTRAVERANDALLGSFRSEPGRWARIWEGALGELLGGLVLTIVLALGQQPHDNVLPPPAPVIQIENSTTVEVEVEPTAQDGPGAVDADVVDAEIVEDPDSSGT